MKEWICREMSTSTSGNENGVLMMETELIRCKDCKHWRANTQFCSMFSGLCTAHRMPPDGYCSEAERKDNETD